MSFQYQYISYKDTGYFSSLVTDYLAGDKRLDGYYSFTPDTKGLKAAVEQRGKYPVDRKVLVDTLTRQYEGLEIHERVAKNIQLLAQENTFTVCTAHQPNLLTGYLYFVYKILHAIQLAETLTKEYPDKNFVPVYYMGSEDNDLAELGSFQYKGDTYVWDAEGQEGAVGRMKTKGLKRLLNELFRLLGPPGENCDKLKDILHKAYLEHSTIATATQYLINELFGQYGLVVLNPDEAAFKKSISKILQDELLNQTSQKIVAETIDKLATHYKTQAQPREINLFYLTDGLRERIEKNGERWTVVNSSISWNKEELLAELKEHPERFSPNVILRGLLQESILPDVAFIGGGAEVAYWLQLQQLFGHYRVFYPAVLLRQSVLWVEKEQKALAEKLGYNAGDIFAPPDKLIEHFVKQNSTGDWHTEKETAAIEKILQDLRQKAADLDATLYKSADAVMTGIKNRLATLEKKMLRAEKRKMQVQTGRIERLKDHLFPSNNLQERVDNFLPYYAKYGAAFFETIKNGILPFENKFLIVERLT